MLGIFSFGDVIFVHPFYFVETKNVYFFSISFFFLYRIINPNYKLDWNSNFMYMNFSLSFFPFKRFFTIVLQLIRKKRVLINYFHLVQFKKKEFQFDKAA